MKEGPDIARVATLIGDPARANMLTALMSGKALTATELAAEAGVTLQTASSHLGKLNEGGLLIPRKQGRHKYFAIASPDVATVLEGLMGLAAESGHTRTRTGPKNDALRKARVCYNHLAGDMGVQLYEALLAQGLLAETGTDPMLTEDGRSFAENFGIDVAALERAKAPLCKSCLDWSARRTHLAGRLGRALFAQFVDMGWAGVDRATRVVTFTPSGEIAFRSRFPV